MTKATRNSSRPYLGIGIVAAVILAAVAWYLAGSGQPRPTGGGSKQWFTTDDGKTWFADSSDKLPPFQKDGKPAYGCVVMSSDDGKRQWVAYLFRFRQPSSQQAGGARAMPPELQRRAMMEVKQPGDTAWVGISDRQGIEITSPPSHNGQSGFVPVLP